MHQKNVNAMRSLALNAIKTAGQGHTGMAMSAAPLTYTVYTEFMNIEKSQPKWINRDRFVLSAGHGSMSIYSIFHFAGLLSMNDIKKHKTKGSKTPGHPEYEKDNFVDASTGPLGQGVAIGVGMAIAEKAMANKFKNLKKLIDHKTFVVVGDGCLQEGISYEAMSLAGKLNLNKLIVLHDSNDFQIDCGVKGTFIENLELRMKAMNWSYQKCSNDPLEIKKAIKKAAKFKKPAFIEVKTIIGEGTSAANSRQAHGLKVDSKEEKLFQAHFKTSHQEFEFKKTYYDYFEKRVVSRGNKAYEQWKALYDEYATKYPEEIKQFDKFLKGDFPSVGKIINAKEMKQPNVATRDYVKNYLHQLAKKVNLKWFLVGSADLASATNVSINLSKSFADDSRNVDVVYGIREFAMAGIQNGILLHGGLKTIASTFLAFSDYMKSAIRLGALNNLPAAYIFTHDSYQVGGDGPTHQPFDQLPMLRAIANTYVYRPCDANETKFVFEKLFNAKKGTQIGVFTRQPLKANYPSSASKASKGGYVLYDEADADLTLVGSGSEIDLLVRVRDKLKKKNIHAKIVSVPCLKLFFSCEPEYIQATLKSKNGIFSVEPSSDYLWYKLFRYGKNYAHLGAYTFGESMDGNELYREKGFNSTNVMEILKKSKLI